MTVEAAKEAGLLVSLVVDGPLELHVAPKGQALLNLGACPPAVLRSCCPTEHLADLASFSYSELFDFLERGLHLLELTRHLLPTGP